MAGLNQGHTRRGGEAHRHPDHGLSVGETMSHDGQPRPVPRAALWGGAVALLAVVLELWGSWGTGASASAPASWFVASGWPTLLRVLWWTIATVGVFAANRGLAHMAGSPRRVSTAVAVAPFVAFTIGIALGAEWATWH